MNRILKKADSSDQEAGEDKYGSGQVTVQESFGSMVQTYGNPHDRNELYGVSVSVCASICIQTSFDFFGGG